MATLVQSAKASNNSATTVVVTLDGTAGTTVPVAGNILIACCGSPTGARTYTCADNVNGTYTANGSNTPRAVAYVFVSPVIAGGATTITGTISGAATQVLMLVQEWNGFQGTTPFDKGTGTNGGAVNGPPGSTGTTATLTGNSDIAIGVCAVANSPGAGFAVTTTGWSADSKSPVTTANGGIAIGYMALSGNAAVSASFTWTTAAQWGGAIATYQAIPPSAAGGTMPFSSVQFFIQDRVLAL